MKLVVRKTDYLEGRIKIPGSKSHTIRAVIIASLAEGESVLSNPLASEDALAAVEACRALGADIKCEKDKWFIKGFGRSPSDPGKSLYLANSGTSTRIITGIVSLFGFEVIIDGDASLRTRPMQNLVSALNSLGADIVYSGDEGKCPLKMAGRIRGGSCEVDGLSSQFVTSLLLAAPMAPEDTEIRVRNLHEESYVRMTLSWLDKQGIIYEASDDLSYFRVKGNQAYRAFDAAIPSDWSSAAFPAVAASVCRSDVSIEGLDISDPQGDKAILGYLKSMGGDIEYSNGIIRIKGKPLKGVEIDLNDTPDALPALSVLGCFAKGSTKLYNVKQARIKETDRISVMASELTKLGASIRELPDGLIISESKLNGNSVFGHNDHRVVMALSLAGLMAEGITDISDPDAVNVTFPGYVDMMNSIKADMSMEDKQDDR